MCQNRKHDTNKQTNMTTKLSYYFALRFFNAICKDYGGDVGTMHGKEMQRKISSNVNYDDDDNNNNNSMCIFSSENCRLSSLIVTFSIDISIRHQNECDSENSNDIGNNILLFRICGACSESIGFHEVWKRPGLKWLSKCSCTNYIRMITSKAVSLRPRR